jgi:hypothetical protein
MSIEAMKLALEALELAKRSYGVILLSDPPQDAWKTRDVNRKIDNSIKVLEEALAKQEQGEPVAYINIEKRRLEWAHDYMSWNTPTVVNLPRIPLYTTPQQRKPLTDEPPKRWAVFCGICRKEWSVPYQHSGKSVCDECVAAHGIKE